MVKNSTLTINRIKMRNIIISKCTNIFCPEFELDPQCLCKKVNIIIFVITL
jgi:hypothetical protein